MFDASSSLRSTLVNYSRLFSPFSQVGDGKCEKFYGDVTE